MMRRELSLSSSNKGWYALLALIPLALFMGYQSGAGHIVLLLYLFGILGASVLILMSPAWGVMLIVAQLSIEASLILRSPGSLRPSVVLGAVAVLGFVMARKSKPLFSYSVSPVMTFSALFVAWVIARSGRSPSVALTYVQLAVLTFLASELMTPSRHDTFLLLFVVGTTLGALYYSFLIRQEGGTGEATLTAGTNRNTISFYYAVALIMAIYLHRQLRGWWRHWVFPVVYVILVGSIIFAESRAALLNLVGILLIVLFVWPVLLRMQPGGEGSKTPITRQNVASLTLMLSLFLVARFVLTDEYIAGMNRRLFQPAQQGIIEIDEGRAELVRQGWQTFLSNPIAGVGIRQFGSTGMSNLRSGLTVHNLYVLLLAETGLVGFIFFMAWLLLATYYFFLVFRSGDPRYRSLALLWLTIMLLVFVRGFTASTLHYDKLLWCIGGASIALKNGAMSASEPS